MSSTRPESVGDLQEEITRLKKENVVLRQIVNSVRSDGTDVDLISYAGTTCILGPIRGGWQLRFHGEEGWVPVGDVDELLVQTLKEK